MCGAAPTGWRTATPGYDESYESTSTSAGQCKTATRPAAAARCCTAWPEARHDHHATFRSPCTSRPPQRDDEGVAPGGPLGRDCPRVGNRDATASVLTLDSRKYLQYNQNGWRRDTFAFRDAPVRDRHVPGLFVHARQSAFDAAPGVLSVVGDGRAWAGEGVGCFRAPAATV